MNTAGIFIATKNASLTPDAPYAEARANSLPKPRILATKVAAINPTAAFATLDMISLSYTLLTLIYLIILYFNIMYNSL